MSFKESLRVLRALEALPYDEAAAVVELWMDSEKPKPTTAAKVEARPRPGRGSRECLRYTQEEVDRLSQLISSGLRQVDIAKTMYREFNKSRTVGAWEKIAQKMACGYMPKVEGEASND